MKVKLLLLFACMPFLAFSQQFTRKVFEYEKATTKEAVQCDSAILLEIDQLYNAIWEYNSKKAVAMGKKLFDQTDCFQVYDAYGFALFRSGAWLEGVEIIEKGIDKFGNVPELIKRRSDMSLEMAELGIGQKNIDGNSVYKANAMPYDEKQFVAENFKSALEDLEYLVANFQRSEETFYMAKVHQQLGNYDQSTTILKTLLEDEEFKSGAYFNVADNYMSQKNWAEAETYFNALLTELPDESAIYNKLSEIYTAKNDPEKATELKNKGVYYQYVPQFLNLEYSTANFDLLKLFGSGENKPADKIKKLNELAKQDNQEHTISVCLMVLKLHANHGNGVEERATELLAKIGKPAVSKVNQLFQTDVSTCTITNLAEIMAVVKDETSWELLTAYLPNIANMPMTLIPPNVPEKMMQFDENKGLVEILKVVKPLLMEEEENDDAMAGLGNFSQYVYFAPLKTIGKQKLKKAATELNYSDSEFKELESRIR